MNSDHGAPAATSAPRTRPRETLPRDLHALACGEGANAEDRGRGKPDRQRRRAWHVQRQAASDGNGLRIERRGRSGGWQKLHHDVLDVHRERCRGGSGVDSGSFDFNRPRLCVRHWYGCALAAIIGSIALQLPCPLVIGTIERTDDGRHLVLAPKLCGTVAVHRARA
jgi:hypothetical protein